MTETQKDYQRLQEIKWQEKMVKCPCRNELEDEGVYCTASTMNCSYRDCVMIYWGMV